MDAIKAKVKNGRVETEQPLDFPDGTNLLILPADSDIPDVERDWDDSPEGIQRWLDWYDSLQPLIFTDEERAALEKDRAERKAWELSTFNERADKLRRLWE